MSNDANSSKAKFNADDRQQRTWFESLSALFLRLARANKGAL
jgi:hypothetical protein